MAKAYTDRKYAGTLTTTQITIPIAVGTKFIPAGIIITNANAADKKAEIIWGITRLLPYVNSIDSGEFYQAENPLPPLLAGETIKLKGEVASDMDYVIWGLDETDV